jgi:outer membrane lipoprotein-sorting protein
MKTWMLALLLLAPRQEKAEELLKAAQERIAAAATLRTRFTIEIGRAGNPEGTVVGAILMKGSDRWRVELEAKSGRGGREDIALSLYSDGRKVSSARPGTRTMLETLGADRASREFREAFGSTLLPILLYMQPVREGRMMEEFRLGSPRITDVKDGGKEKLGDVEARIVEYTLSFEQKLFGDKGVPVKAWLDPKTKLVLKREMEIFGSMMKEEFAELAAGEELADSEFAFQSARRLAAMRAVQLARSAELFTRFSGRSPKSLDELLRRPEGLDPAVFYPAGGYVLGGALPKDPWGRPYLLQDGQVRSLGADGKAGGKGDDEDASARIPASTGQAVGGPTERLRNHYGARIQVHLLVAAVQAFSGSYGELPKKRAALWEKQDWMTVWPEGGWLPGGAMPADPWGQPLRMVSEVDSVRIQVQDPAARRITLKELTKEERASLEATAQPKLSAEDAKALSGLLADLADDDLDRREKAESRIRAMGLPVVPALEARILAEKDVEARGRLEGIRRSIKVPKAAWMTELQALSHEVLPREGGLGVQTASNERNASACLKTIATAQADFRANDRDNNNINDFWTGDVASLYTLVPDGSKEAIKLIELSVAAADAAPLGDGAEILKVARQAPKAGYHFRAMTTDNSSGTPEPYGMDTGGVKSRGKVYNHSRFGVCAYPAEYGVGGTKTYIINEGNTIFVKDTEGEPILEWPSDADLREWSTLD